MTDDAYRHEALTQQIIARPFLNTINGRYIAALNALHNLHRSDEGSKLRFVLSHPALRNGNTDDQTALFAKLPRNVKRALEQLNSQP